MIRKDAPYRAQRRKTGGGWPRAVLLAVLLAVCAACAVPSAQAQQVTARVSADTVVVGQRFFLTLTATHDPAARAVFPDELPREDPSAPLTLGDLDVLGRRAAGTRRAPGGLQVDSVVYEVATFALDTAFVAPIAIPFTADADTFSAATPAFMVPVASTVPPDAEDIRDLAPLVPFERIFWHLILALLVTLALAGLFWYYRTHRTPAPAPLVVAAPAAPVASPYEEAVARLRSLDAADLSATEAVKPFYVELSEALRTYLERRLGVPAMEETTHELVRDLRDEAQRGRLGEEVPAAVNEVLALADFAKFADGRPSAEAGRAALDRTKTTLQTVETRRRAPVPPPGIPSSVRPVGEAAFAPSGANGHRRRNALGALEQHLAEQIDAEEAAPEKKAPLLSRTVIVALVLGLALAFYAGGHVVLPFLVAALVYAAATRLAPPARRPLAETLALHAGLYGWMFIGYMMTPELVAVPWLASAEVLVVIGGLAWLMIRPGWGPVALLGVILMVGLAANGIGLWQSPMGSEASQAFAVHVALRLGALITLVLGVLRWRDAADA